MYINSAIRSVTLRVSCSLAISKRMTSVGIRALMRSSRSLTRLSSICRLKRSAKSLAQHRVVLQGIAEVLGERAFARAEEARDPDADALVRLGRCLGDRLEQWAYWSRMLSVATYSVISA